MSKRVLSIGQCGFDHASISATLQKHFGAVVTPCDDYAEAARWMDDNEGPPDLVLVNRKLDADGGDGLAVVRTLKEHPATSSVPVMLVSNYPEYQAQAAALGAVPGFGKAELVQTETLDNLRRYLG